MNMKICFYNSITNFRSLLEISAFDRPQLIFVKRFKSLIVYSLTSYIILPKMKIIALKNLSIINKIQSHSFDKDKDFENAKMKSMIKM